MTDEELLLAFVRAEDAAALSALAERYRDAAWRLARSVLGSGADAEDAAGVAFARLLERAGTYRGAPGGFRSWFFRIVVNAARDVSRRNRARAAAERRLAEAPSARPDRDRASPAAALEKIEMEQAAKVALAGLPEELRLPVHLCAVEGLTHAEAALALGVPRRTISERYDRGLEALRRTLSRAGYVAPPLVLLAALGSLRAEAAPATFAARLAEILAGTGPPADLADLVETGGEGGGGGGVLGRAAEFLGTAKGLAAASAAAVLLLAALAVWRDAGSRPKPVRGPISASRTAPPAATTPTRRAIQPTLPSQELRRASPLPPGSVASAKEAPPLPSSLPWPPPPPPAPPPEAVALAEDAPILAGTLCALDPGGGGGLLALPVLGTTVRAELDGLLARVEVTRRFANPLAAPAEAACLFPLPPGAAVEALEVVAGRTRVRGTVLPREEARAHAARARLEGRLAALGTADDRSLFVQEISSLPPGKEVLVTLRTRAIVSCDRDRCEWSFPLAAAGPGGAGDDSIEVLLDAGGRISRLGSPTHGIEVERLGANRARIRLQRAEGGGGGGEFILRYEIARDSPGELLAHRSPGEPGTFLLLLRPTAAGQASAPRPRELVLVLDGSASMAGAAWDGAGGARALALSALAALSPEDAVQVVSFSGASGAAALFPEAVPATAENVRLARRHVEALRPGGRTPLVEALERSLAPPADGLRPRVVLLVTDGQVEDEAALRALVEAKLGAARLFTVGAGDRPNRALLARLAALGGGLAPLLPAGSREPGPPGAPAEDRRAVAEMLDRLARPLWTDLHLDWGSLAVEDVFAVAGGVGLAEGPAGAPRLPDLFRDQPLVVLGRYREAGEGTVRLSGRRGGEAFSLDLPVRLPEAEPGHEGLPPVWGAAKVGELVLEAREGRAGAAEEAVRLACELRIASEVTAFAAFLDEPAEGGALSRRTPLPPARGGRTEPPAESPTREEIAEALVAEARLVAEAGRPAPRPIPAEGDDVLADLFATPRPSSEAERPLIPELRPRALAESSAAPSPLAPLAAAPTPPTPRPRLAPGETGGELFLRVRREAAGLDAREREMLLRVAEFAAGIGGAPDGVSEYAERARRAIAEHLAGGWSLSRPALRVLEELGFDEAAIAAVRSAEIPGVQAAGGPGGAGGRPPEAAKAHGAPEK